MTAIFCETPRTAFCGFHQAVLGGTTNIFVPLRLFGLRNLAATSPQAGPRPGPGYSGVVMRLIRLPTILKP